MAKISNKFNLRKSFKNGISNGVYIFFVFQLLSLLGYFYPSVSTLVFFLVVSGTALLAWHKVEYGFLILIFEFFAGHGGHLFEFADLSLRTTLFLIVIFIWLFNKLTRRTEDKGFFRFSANSPLLILFSLLLFLIFFGLVNGIINNNDILAIKDFMNYWYLFLIFPLVDLLKKQDFKERVFAVSKVGIIGIVLLTFIVFILFTTDLVEVHDSFYWWWREVVIGKATYAGNNFFRIVTPAHLLILPIFLVLLGLLSVSEKKEKGGTRCKLVWLAVPASLAVLINFSRAYFLGILVGLIFLLKGLNWRRWLIFSLTVVVVLALEFGLLYALVSGGQVFQGFGYFRERMKTVLAPEDELSSLTRMNILPVLAEKIKERPFFGRGLGAEVSYQNSLTKEIQTTFHLDWGYLEIWLELGLLSLLVYALILFFIFYRGWRKIKTLPSGNIFEKRLVVGLLAGLASIAVANLTSPFLFHPLGIFYLVFTAALVNNQ